MRVLICTQAVDRNDPVLGFFVTWITELAKHYEQANVICLKEGTHDLPSNVKVYSLGKERGSVSRFVYACRFLRLIFTLRKEYDSVFVHMNQEYVLLGGIFWKLSGKHIYLWRNHYSGSFLTDLAALFCTKVFCTSKHSYTAKYKKTVLMPVGIDTKLFKPVSSVIRKPRSILFLARIAPSKRPDLLLAALGELDQKGIEFAASIYGDPSQADTAYYQSLKQYVSDHRLADKISFHPGVPNFETPNIYSAHGIFVNLSPSGMLDKTIFEAIACGCIPLVCNKDISEALETRYIVKEHDPEDLANKLHNALDSSRHPDLHELVERHSLYALTTSLFRELLS